MIAVHIYKAREASCVLSFQRRRNSVTLCCEVYTLKRLHENESKQKFGPGYWAPGVCNANHDRVQHDRHVYLGLNKGYHYGHRLGICFLRLARSLLMLDWHMLTADQYSITIGDVICYLHREPF